MSSRVPRILFISVIVVLYLMQCTKKPGPTDQSSLLIDSEQALVRGNKIILFGIDGGEWHILQPMIKMGRLPTIERLLLTGSYSRTISPTATSPTEWTSIVTGKNSDKHGITSFVKDIRKTGVATTEKPVVINTRYDRTCDTIWNIFSDRSISVGIIGWWASWPAEKVEGHIITDAFLHRDKAQNTFYPPSAETALNEVAAEATLKFQEWLNNHAATKETLSESTDFKDLRFLTGGVDSFFDQLRFDFMKMDIATYLLTVHNPDFLALYLRASDIASHFFYKEAFLRDGERRWKISPQERELFGHLICSIYKLYDTYLGEMLALFDQYPTLIFVSDHGFQASRGYSPRFMTRKFLQQTKLNIENMPLHDIFDLERAGADSKLIPNNSEMVNNLENEARKNLLQKTSDMLSSLMTLSEKPIFKSVQIIQKKDQQPFLLIKKNPAVTVYDIFDLPDGALQAYKSFKFPVWTGAHRKFAVSIFNGPSIMKNHLIQSEVTTWDMCPTILNLFNLPRAQDMEGISVTEIFTKDYLAQHPLPVDIETYEQEKSDDEDTPELPTDLNEAVIDELKSIGYL